MRGKKAKELKRLARAMAKLEPVRVITGYKAVWYNPLSWIFKRYKKAVFHYKDSKFYEGIAKEAYYAVRGAA